MDDIVEKCLEQIKPPDCISRCPRLFLGYFHSFKGIAFAILHPS